MSKNPRSLAADGKTPAINMILGLSPPGCRCGRGLRHDVGGTLEYGWILNLAAWLAIFVAGASRRLHRDTRASLIQRRLHA